jgi:uncharacterized membrane protein YbhN (UPF0104 family)
LAKKIKTPEGSLGNGLFLWPTGLIIIVTYGHEHDLFGYTITAISVILNIALYAAAVMLLWFMVWIVRRVATTKRWSLEESVAQAGTT